jgi:hypothetical protein
VECALRERERGEKREREQGRSSQIERGWHTERMAAGLGGGGGSSGQPAVPKILLAKPATPRSDGGVPGSSGAPAGTLKLMRDRDDDSAGRAVRLPHGSLNLLSDSWDFAPDRFLPVSFKPYVSSFLERS